MKPGASQPPLVFIVSGPSGSGKSTLVEKLLEVPGTLFSISCTTRPPRVTEIPGKWYDFISEAEFDRRASQGEFLEYARVFSRHQYGTPRRWFEEAQRKGLDLVLEIDVQGAEQVKRELPGAVAIFILPPSREELERRLRARGQDSQEAIARRLDVASAAIWKTAPEKFWNHLGGNDLMAAENQAPDSKFAFVVIAARRARQLMLGATPLVANPRSHKPTRVAVEELRAGALEYQLPEIPGEGEDREEKRRKE
jgi:guanylate kinase